MPHPAPRVLRSVRAATASGQPPIDGQAAGPGGQAVVLPDTLDLALRRPDVRLHYWIDLASCAEMQDGVAVAYIYRIGAPYRAYLHEPVVDPTTGHATWRRRYVDHWLPTASLTDRLIEHLPTHVHNGRVPAAFALPAGARWLELELTAMAYMPTGVASVMLGPATLLGPLQAKDLQLLVSGSDLVAGISILIGAVAFLIHRRRRQNQGMWWFALGCATWGLRNLFYINASLPGSGHGAELFLSLGMVICGISMALCALYAAAQMTPIWVKRLSWAMLATALASVASMAVPALATPTRLLGFLLTMLAIAGAAWVLMRRPARAQGVSLRVQRLLAWALVAQIAAAVHDVGIVLGIRPPDSLAIAFWGFSALLLAMALLGAARIVAALGRAENTNLELEQRVAEKNAALQLSYAAVRDAELSTERRQARTQERERLNREMHDGLGAQLITALRGVERGALSKEQVADALQQGLDELRLLMDASDLGRSLHGALVAWRNRWEDRLLAVGISLEWQLDPALEAIELGSDTTLQIMRVLQEATTNVVKHAGASLLQVSASRQHATLVLAITDNGCGLPATLAHATGVGQENKGRGWRNMRQRSEQMGGTLHIASLLPPQRGTLVRLVLAMGAAALPESAPAPFAAS